MSNNFQRVFFHEVGHFVAKELNFKLNGIGEAESIELESIGYNNEYLGRTKPKIPAGVDPNRSIVHLAEKLASLVYGCFIQSLFLNQNFTICFDMKGNGIEDLKEWDGILLNFSNKRSEIIKNEEKYFEKLISLKENGHFDSFFGLNPDDYVIKDINNLSLYHLNLNAVRANIDEFLEIHQQYYYEFLNEIKNILEI